MSQSVYTASMQVYSICIHDIGGASWMETTLQETYESIQNREKKRKTIKMHLKGS